MANSTVEQLPKCMVKLTITVSPEELQPFLEAAATRLSEATPIQGFRPGKAGYDVVKQKVGEMKIYEEALEPIVRKTYVEALFANKIDTVGSPNIDVTTLAPGNALVYTAEVSRVPNIEKLADFRTMSVAKKAVNVGDSDVDLTLKDLQRMQTKEVRATSGLVTTDKDKVVVSMNMKKDGVAVEGGQSPNHAIYLAESYYIPGLKEQVVGMKEGEAKSFTLKFPDDHSSKMLAGADIEFDVTLNELYHLQSPALDDAFALSLGQKDIVTMKEVIQKNILDEKTNEESFRQEKELLEAIAKDSRFEDIPDMLLTEEVNKMLRELEEAVVRQGGVFDDYLKSIKKTIGDLKLEFAPQALVRVKVALVLREISKLEKVVVEEKAVEDELDALAKKYEDADSRKRIYSPEYRDFVELRLKNRKTLDLLKGIMVK